MHYTCIVCISIGSVTKMEKNYPQVYLEECKYKVKKKKMPEFRDVDWELDSDSEWLHLSTYQAEPRSHYMTNLLHLFQIFRSSFELEFYLETWSHYSAVSHGTLALKYLVLTGFKLSSQ